jgi:hypothetical protein
MMRLVIHRTKQRLENGMGRGIADSCGRVRQTGASSNFLAIADKIRRCAGPFGFLRLEKATEIKNIFIRANETFDGKSRLYECSRTAKRY